VYNADFGNERGKGGGDSGIYGVSTLIQDGGARCCCL
jgi:hypothetical protein